MQHRRISSRGFTLYEALTASVVLALAVIAIAGSLGASYKESSAREESAAALDLARELMEDVAAKPMDPTGTTNALGWSSGQHDRTQYDTLDDFDGYTDTSSSIGTSSGGSIDAGNGEVYTRAVSITWNAKPTGFTGTAADFALVKVVVTTPRGQSFEIDQLVTRATVKR